MSITLPTFSNLINHINDVPCNDIYLPPLNIPSNRTPPFANLEPRQQLAESQPLPYTYPLSPPLSETTRSRSSSDPLSIQSSNSQLGVVPFSVGDTSPSPASTPAPSVSESSPVSTSRQQVTLKKPTKPRKKRQCPECKLFFSNLATHKSTHLKVNLRPHVCEVCSRGFARPNDLIRHTKRHWKEIGGVGQFKCPFFDHSHTHAKNGSSDHDDGSDDSEDERQSNSSSVCHSTGVFSRCDTFKNHLKALHFLYPIGTKKLQRSVVDGNCRECGMYFKNVDDWLANHIDKKLCTKIL